MHAERERERVGGGLFVCLFVCSCGRVAAALGFDWDQRLFRLENKQVLFFFRLIKISSRCSDSKQEVQRKSRRSSREVSDSYLARSSTVGNSHCCCVAGKHFLSVLQKVEKWKKKNRKMLLLILQTVKKRRRVKVSHFFPAEDGEKDEDFLKG